MMGMKKRHFKQHGTLRLETLVPEDHFYRQLEAKLDLSFVRDLVRTTYCEDNGRPSIDPIVFFKLQLIMFFEDFRSERQLIRQVDMNLALRWYIGYDLDEPIPGTSTLSRLRERYGVKIFVRFFERIVHLCWAAGLIWGKEQHIDTSFVKANADYDRQVPRFYWEGLQQHLQARFQQDEGVFAQLITKYNQPQKQNKYSNYTRRRDYWVCPTDPDATPADRGQMAYRLHYVADGGKARIITACLVTPNATQDPAPMLDLIWYVRFRFGSDLRRVVADTRYGTQDHLIALYQQGIFPYIPFHSTKAKQRRINRCFPLEEFVYDTQNDTYRCPQGEILYYSHLIPNTQRRIYKANAKICSACLVREQCTTSKNGRTVSHPVVKPLLDRIATQRNASLFQKLIRKRQVWIEPKFGELKQWHHGWQFRLHTIYKVNIEALIRAAGQNIKQLLKLDSQQHPPPDLPFTVTTLFSLTFCNTLSRYDTNLGEGESQNLLVQAQNIEKKGCLN